MLSSTFFSVINALKIFSKTFLILLFEPRAARAFVESKKEM